jgi:hypothetical protein
MKANQAIIQLIEILLSSATTFEDGHEHALADDTARALQKLRDRLSAE